MSVATQTQTTVDTDAPSQADLRAALVGGERPPAASALAAVRAFAWRGMLKIKHVPEQLVDVTVMPVMFLVMFTYLFGGAVSGSTGEYLQFILPGILVQSIVFVSVYSGVALNTDMTKGAVDRFRTMPIWRPAPLVGAVGGDALRYVLAAAVTLAVGFILGFRAAGGPLGVIAGVALTTVFTFGLSWAFTVLGLLMRTPNAVTNAGFTALMPLIFLSNILIPPSTLPPVVKAFVDVNPVSTLTTAVRGFMAGSPDWTATTITLATGAVLFVVFGALTARLYRR